MERPTDSASSQAPEAPPARRRRSEVLIFILPNLFTTANLFFGYFSILSAIRGNWANAAWAIIVAGLADGLDGRVARLTKTQTAFGEQYDSMSDLVSFGLAPAVLMYQWALLPYGRLAVFVSFMYLTCAALRLARFNVLKQSTEKRYFQGCPSPIAAGAVATAVLFYGALGFEAWKSIYMLIVMSVLAATMVSTVRYRSFKDLHFSSQKDFGVLLLLIGILVLFCTFPEKLLFPVFIVYVVTGPIFEFTRWARRKFKWRGGSGRKAAA